MSRKLVLVCALLVAIPCIANALTGADIARRAYESDKKVSYRGVKSTFVRVGETSTRAILKVVHLMPDKTRKEYFSPPSLAGTIVVQSGPEVWKTDKADPFWEVGRSSSYGPGRSRNCATALTNFEVRLLGSARVAGRDTYVISAVPKNGKEPSRRIWVDKECFVVLRIEAVSREKVLLSSSGFTAIEVNPSDISPNVFTVPGKVKSFPTPEGLDFRVLRPTYLPAGYRMVGLTKETANGHHCAHLQYSNGVYTMSLFERRCRGESVIPRVPDKLTTILSWTKDGTLLTLVGEPPRAELEKVAKSTK